MSTAGTRILFRVVRCYVVVFCFLFPNYRHTRREHTLIESSIQHRADVLVEQGAGTIGAAVRSIWEHLPELEPVGLVRKTLADATTTETTLTSRAWYAARVGMASVIVAAGIFLAASPGASTSAVGEWGRPASVTRSGEPEPVGTSESLRESLYRATGVCISEDITGATLTEQLAMHGSPGADCSDLD